MLDVEQGQRQSHGGKGFEKIASCDAAVHSILRGDSAGLPEGEGKVSRFGFNVAIDSVRKPSGRLRNEGGCRGRATTFVPVTRARTGTSIRTESNVGCLIGCSPVRMKRCSTCSRPYSAD